MRFQSSYRLARGALQRIDPRSIRRILRHFGPHLRTHRPTLAIAALCTVGAAAMELLRPWPLKLIFDGILMPSPGTRAFLDGLPLLGSDPGLLLAGIALAVLAIAVAGGIFRYWQAYLTSLAGQKVVAGIRVQLFGHVQRLSQSFHDTRSSGDLMTGDINLMRDLMVNSFIQLSDSALLITGMIGVMLWMDWPPSPAGSPRRPPAASGWSRPWRSCPTSRMRRARSARPGSKARSSSIRSPSPIRAAIRCWPISAFASRPARRSR